MAQDMIIGNEDQQLPAANAGTNVNNSSLNSSTSSDAVTILQQFCLLAKGAHGAARLELVRQVLEAPNVYVFGELLAVPNIEELKHGADVKYHNTLNLFAYGTYKQYRQNVADYIELTAAMQKKLQHLTLVSLAIKQKSIPYSVLLEELEINNIRDLEDIIIEAIYADIIHGKLFQNTRILEIDYAQGRDIPPGYASKVAQTLEEWVNSCNSISTCIDEQIQHANLEKAKRFRNKERIEQELINLRKVLKTQQSDSDESMQVDTRDNHAGPGPSQDLRKKATKIKAARSGAGKSSSTTSSSVLSSSSAVAAVLAADLKVTSASGGGGGSGASGGSGATSWYKSLTKSFDKE